MSEIANSTTPAASAVTATQSYAEIKPDSGNPDEPKSPFSSSWFLIVIIGIWVMFLWISRRNNKQREHKRQEELNQIKRGDRVVTIGRIHGIVTATTDQTFTIRPDPNKEFTLTFDREALLRVEKDKDDDAEANKDKKQN